jgi:hypothetical protein
MMSDVITNKSEAKNEIRGAIIGLLLIIGAVILLNTINPKLTAGGLNLTQQNLKDIKLNIKEPVIKVSVDAGGNTVVTGAPTNADGVLFKPKAIAGALRCLSGGSGWCMQQKYITWSGSIFTYDLDRHCTDYANSATPGDGNAGKQVCTTWMTKTLTLYDDPSPDVFGYCKLNGAKISPVNNGILSCQFPIQITKNVYFQNIYEEQQLNRTTDDIANNGPSRPYDEDVDFKKLCEQEVNSRGIRGQFVMIDNDLYDFESQYYRCVWYE